MLKVDGLETPFKTFSAASGGVTNTSRNGWMDWYLLDANGQWLLADDWRKNDMTNGAIAKVETAS